MADDAGAAVAAFATGSKVSHVVCDFSPLREAKRARKRLSTPYLMDRRVAVDAHNVVPVWAASPKQRSARARCARRSRTSCRATSRELPPLAAQGPALQPTVDWRPVIKAARQKADRTVAPVDWLTPGSKAAIDALEAFCGDGRLKRFAKHRNDPNVEAASHLSPYLNFGQLSCQRAALRVRAERSSTASPSLFWKSRSLNCRTTSPPAHYACWRARRPGARLVGIACVRTAKTPVVALEKAEAAEDVWNAAQRQLVRQGKMQVHAHVPGDQDSGVAPPPGSFPR